MDKSNKKESYAQSHLKYLLLTPPDKRNKYEIQEISDMILSLVKFLTVQYPNSPGRGIPKEREIHIKI